MHRTVFIGLTHIFEGKCAPSPCAQSVHSVRALSPCIQSLCAQSLCAQFVRSNFVRCIPSYCSKDWGDLRSVEGGGNLKFNIKNKGSKFCYFSNFIKIIRYLYNFFVF